jgi:uncharacterized protein YggE
MLRSLKVKNWFIISLLIFLANPSICRGQAMGNSGYSENGGRARAAQRGLAKRVLTKDELPPTGTSTFVECSVLMNVKADEYVAVFGITQEGETLAECSDKMDLRVKAFTADLNPLGISSADLFVDFVAQTRLYAFEAEGDLIQEKLAGFELKKNLLIHYKDASLLDRISLAAAQSQVFDLIKVDYIVKDVGRVQDRLMEEAATVTKNKISRYEKLLGIKLQHPAQVYAEKSTIHYPTQMYDSYQAYESEGIESSYYRQKYTVRFARKSKTFFFNGLDADGFDSVLNPVITEPVVQFTLYLKVKYEVEQTKAK